MGSTKRAGEEIARSDGRSATRARSVAAPPAPAVDTTAVIAFAAKNRKNRFFIPSRDNSIAGIGYPKMMIHSGCGSMLLPFPPGGMTELTEKFSPQLYDLALTLSEGTGAIHSSVLKIKSKIGQGFSIKLNGRVQPVTLPILRFHMGSEAAKALRDAEVEWLTADDETTLRDFVASPGELEIAERKHVLVGQSYIGRTFSAQMGAVIIFMEALTWSTSAADLPHLIAASRDQAAPLVEGFDGFHDLEDEDHDAAGEQEDVRLSWDSDAECVDELVT